MNGALMENLHKVLWRFLLLEHRTVRRRSSGFWMAISIWWRGCNLHRLFFYGRVPDECKGNIVHIKQFSDKWNEAEVAQW